MRQVQGSGSERYRLIRKLGEGGMAEVYLARNTGPGGFSKEVVLKRIRSEHAVDDQFVSMFHDEAQIAASLNHPNIAQVYDFGKNDAGEYYLTMEYLDGADLHRLFGLVQRSGEPFPLEYALTIVCGVASGLHYAHERRNDEGDLLGVVHRDVSLSNIMVSREGAVKLLDFGVARAHKRSADTRTGGIKGKITYLSPEQIRGQRLDRRSDAFALGIVLYELTTTSRLYAIEGASDFAIMEAIVDGHFPPPGERHPGYPSKLERIVRRALAVDPDQRYNSCQEILRDLEKFASERQIALSTHALGDWVGVLIDAADAPATDVASSSTPGRAGAVVAPTDLALFADDDTSRTERQAIAELDRDSAQLSDREDEIASLFDVGTRQTVAVGFDRPNAPLQFEDTTQRDPDPHGRFPIEVSPTELAPARASTVDVAPPTSATTDEYPEASSETPIPERPDRRRRVVVAGVAAAAALVAAGIGLIGRSSETSRSSGAPEENATPAVHAPAAPIDRRSPNAVQHAPTSDFFEPDQEDQPTAETSVEPEPAPELGVARTEEAETQIEPRQAGAESPPRSAVTQDPVAARQKGETNTGRARDLGDRGTASKPRSRGVLNLIEREW